MGLIDYLSMGQADFTYFINIHFCHLNIEYYPTVGPGWVQDLIILEGQNFIIKICKFLLSYPSKVLHHGWVKLRVLGEHHLLTSLSASQCPGGSQLFLSFLVTVWCLQSLRDPPWCLLMFYPLAQVRFHHYISWGIMSLSPRKFL